MSDGRHCMWCGGSYFERTCEHCEAMIADEQAHAHHDDRRPVMLNPSIELTRGVLTQAHHRKLDAMMDDPAFLALVQPMTDYLNKAYGPKETP